MAFTYGFYNSVNHDRKYDAVQMGQIFDGIITDGIYATYLKAMVVKASSNASEVIVQPGRAWFNHTWSYNDADFPVAAPEPEVVLDRIDTLVLDINAEDASRTNSFLWVQGTPTSQVPEPPALIHTVTHNQYPLCDVYRKAGTTQIYAADITNRVGTSDCPFVTGVLEGINIDDLLAQWDDEFHTWENATKASFEGWMVNQQSVYTAWWDALKAQMASDVEDLEAWIATIHDILDEEVATRLQAEIDEIKTELPSGSHITVTTTDTELYSRTVTITDEANHTVTSQFDATGVAVFKTVPYVGNLTISSTDGTRTATSVVQTPYFARYQFAIAFWSATVNIDGTSELGGETVSITDSSLALVGTVVLNASGLGVFNATYPDTYKFSVTHGGETMSVTLEVSQETTYNVEIHGGFNWQRWVDLSENYSSSDFNDLDELLADQKAVRELMTIHACVDYLASATRADANITQIINNDICAKWINNRDYALDTLYANAAIAAVMDEADKYFYGELAIMPQVPKMTSNTTPSGAASSKDTYEASFAAFHAFDGETGYSNRYIPADGTDTKWIQYMFTHPICVKEVFIALSDTLSAVKERVNRLEVIGSNDGVSWSSPLGSISTDNITDASNIKIYLANNTQYTYYRVNEYKKISSGIGYYTIQFYAYAPKGCVPVMTSNTAPYGVASANSVYSTYAAYLAFDGDDTSMFIGNTIVRTTTETANAELTYQFTSPTLVRKFLIKYPSERPVTKVIVSGSNDGSNFTPLKTINNPASGTTISIPNDNYYLFVKATITARTNEANVYIPQINTVQFYGRQLSVSVPKMTSNTAPYGEASASDNYNTTNYLAYKAFDGSDTSYSYVYLSLNGSDNATHWIEYNFGKSVNIKELVFTYLTHWGSTNSISKIEVLGSNDGQNYTLIQEYQSAHTTKDILKVTVNTSYSRIRVRFTGWNSNADGTGVTKALNIAEAQFYGLDYSEREFEPGTTKKWLYDHGVEVAAINVLASGTGAVATKNSDYVEISTTSATNSIAAMYKQENLSDYNTARCKFGDTFNPTSGYIVLAIYSQVPNASGNGEESILNMSSAYADLPYAVGLNISSFTGNHYVSIHARNGSSGYVKDAKITELWLEE